VNNPPELKAHIKIPGLLSWMAFGDVNATIKGINEFPADEIPPLWMTFVSYHNMVALGMYFILVMLIAAYKIKKNTLWESTKFLKLLFWSIPLPVAACQFGWVAAEVGRQPWIVYKLMRTSAAASITVSAGEILFSIVLFGAIYVLLFVLFMYYLMKEINHGPAPVQLQEAL
jgi:cytochrome bd ubiquinol oxidase subunit I